MPTDPQPAFLIGDADRRLHHQRKRRQPPAGDRDMDTDNPLYYRGSLNRAMTRDDFPRFPIRPIWP